MVVIPFILHLIVAYHGYSLRGYGNAGNMFKHLGACTPSLGYAHTPLALGITSIEIITSQ